MNNKNKLLKLKSSKSKNLKSKSEKKNISKTPKNIKKSFPLPPQPENYKQIKEIYENGKLELVDYKGVITECDIYGSPKKKFRNDITGIIGFQDRLNKGIIKEFKYNNSKSLYIPKTINFEGSFMFPRPLTLPFASQTENPEKLVKEVKKEGRAKVKKNKATFSLKRPLKDNDAIPSFICHKIGENFSNKRNYLIKLIDNFITEKKKEHKFEPDFVKKSLNIKALNNYKKKLNENMTNELYNGKKISATSQKDIILKYESIRKAIYNMGLYNSSSKNINGNSIINFDVYKKLYKVKGVGKEDNIFKHPDKINTFTSQNKNYNIFNLEEKNLSYIVKKGDFKALFQKNDKINPIMMKTYSLIRKGNKYKLFKENNKEIVKNNIEYIFNDEKYKKTDTTEFDKNNYESLINIPSNNKNIKNKNLYTPKNSLNNNRININNNFNIEKYNKTPKNLCKNNKQNLSKSKENNIINNIKNNDNYSYISEEQNKDNNFINKFKLGYNFKSVNDIKKKINKENVLLKGFISPEIKNDIKLKISKNKKTDITLKNYINELELIKKVNKIAIEKENKINLFKDNLLRKKLEAKKILEFNYKK